MARGYPTHPSRSPRFCDNANQTSCGFSSNFFSGTACHQFCHARDRAS
jgi:hypothetical protein